MIALHQGKASAEGIVQCFLEYMQRGGARVSRAEFEANLATKFLDPVFVQDLSPLLVPGTGWNLEEAGVKIHQALISKLPGQPWKKPST